jgi:ABC-type polysaccharide/polyol phosphate export permease
MSGAYRNIADVNPVSHMVEGQRALAVSGWSASAAARALLVPAGIGVVGTALALRALRRRLAAS